jgi:hypothetical protein
MAEVFAEFPNVVVAAGRHTFVPRACGGPMSDGRWQGWIEFVSTHDRHVVRTPRETTQPKRTDLAYWATGLTPIYLEGALDRALHPRVEVIEPVAPPAYDEPAPPAIQVPASESAPSGESVLDPLSAYRKGERLLRSQLAALSPWHLVNIIRAYKLSPLSSGTLNELSAPALIDMIVAAVRERSEEVSQP